MARKKQGGERNVVCGAGYVVVEAPYRRTGMYVSGRLDCHLPAAEAQVLRDIQDGLASIGAQLKSGRHVDNSRGALLWLLENMQPLDVSDRPREARG